MTHDLEWMLPNFAETTVKLGYLARKSLTDFCCTSNSSMCDDNFKRVVATLTKELEVINKIVESGSLCEIYNKV